MLLLTKEQAIVKKINDYKIFFWGNQTKFENARIRSGSMFQKTMFRAILFVLHLSYVVFNKIS